MMWIMENGEGGFCSDRLVELINYCVAGDGTGEESELCFRDARIGPLMGRFGGVSPVLQGLSMQCSGQCQGKMLKRILDQLHGRSRCHEKVYSAYMALYKWSK